MSKFNLFVGSTPFVPAGFAGVAEIETHSCDEIRFRLRTQLAAGGVIESYCGHPATAAWLGVDCSRREAVIGPGDTQIWMGIRPTRRPAPGEELNPIKTPEAFVGWRMVLTAAR